MIEVPDHTAEILQEVMAERVAQIEKGYTSKHDDKLLVSQLVEMADRRAHRRNPVNPGYFYRDHLIEAAALLVAAIECLDRSEVQR